MLVRVLGPVEAGTALDRRDRTALAILTLHRGRPVGVERLADGIWLDHPPASWHKQVQVVMGRLRKELGADTIAFSSEAYRLAIGEDATDVGVFERLIHEGRRHLADDDPLRAAVDLGRALELWRGTPYPELEAWQPAQAEVARLAELHATAEEDLVEAELASGDAGDVVARAAALVREAPLRERRWALLARAHYRAGHQGDALATLAKARDVLVEELGVDPGPELAALELAILRQEPSLPAETVAPSAASPWPGLAAYGEEDADVFFGRDSDVAECADRLLATGLLVLAGASGSGKSSLLRAGILPELRGRGLSAMVLRASDEGVEAVLRTVEAAAVIAVDQVEEAFADGAAAADPAALLASVVRRVEAGGRVILVVRSDHLGRLAIDAHTARLVQRALHLLGPLTGDALRAAIVGPAERSGVRCGPGLVEMLVRDAEGEPGALPLLSHALAETWARRSGPVLTVENYVATGGLRGAVAATAEQFFESLPPERQAVVRSVLLRLVAPTEEGAVRRRVPAAGFHSDAHRADVVTRLVAARLLTVEGVDVVISHEALMRAWPRLRDWLVEDAGRLQLLRRLESDASWWDEHDRPDDALYRGATLQLAAALPSETDGDIGAPAARFLAASHAAAELRARESQQRARATTRRNRALAALLVVAVVTGVLATIGRVNAERAERHANVDALVSASRVLRPSDWGLAALLAVQAHREDPGPLTHSALLSLFTAETRFSGEVHLPGGSFTAAAIPGTSSALVLHDRAQLSPEESVAVVDLRTGATERILPSSSAAFAGAEVAVSGDGSLGVVVENNLTACGPWEVFCFEFTVFDLRSGEAVLGPGPVPFGVSDFTISHDGAWVAVVGAEPGEIAWLNTDTLEAQFAPEVEGGDDVERWDGGPLDGGSALFSADGTLVATDRGGNVRVLDPNLTDAERAAVVPAGFAQTNLERAGTTLVMSGDRGVAAVDLTTMAVVWTQPTAEPSRRCSTLALSEYTAMAYCGSAAGVVEVRDLRTGDLTGETFPAPHGVGGLAVVDEGRELVVFAANGPVISRWRLDGTGPVTDRVAERRSLWDGWGPDGRSIVVTRPRTLAGSGGAVASFDVWDTAEDQRLTGVDGVASLGWMGTGRLTTATVGDGGGLVTYDLSGRLLPEAPPIGAYLPSQVSVHTTQGATRAYLWNGVDRLSRMDADGVPAEAPVFRIEDGARLLSVSHTAAGETVVVSFQHPRSGVIEHVVFSGTTGEELARADPEDRLTLAAVGPDGTLVGAGPGRITRFDRDTFAPLGSFAGEEGQIHSLQFSAAGDLLLAAGIGQVALYDVATGLRIGDPIATPIGLAAELEQRNGFLHPDGTRLAIAARGGVEIWDIDAEHLTEVACRLAARNLTEDEWASHLRAFGPWEETCLTG